MNFKPTTDDQYKRMLAKLSAYDNSSEEHDETVLDTDNYKSPKSAVHNTDNYESLENALKDAPALFKENTLKNFWRFDFKNQDGFNRFLFETIDVLQKYCKV